MARVDRRAVSATSRSSLHEPEMRDFARKLGIPDGLAREAWGLYMQWRAVESIGAIRVCDRVAGVLYVVTRTHHMAVPVRIVLSKTRASSAGMWTVVKRIRERFPAYKRQSIPSDYIVRLVQEFNIPERVRSMALQLSEDAGTAVVQPNVVAAAAVYEAYSRLREARPFSQDEVCNAAGCTSGALRTCRKRIFGWVPPPKEEVVYIE